MSGSSNAYDIKQKIEDEDSIDANCLVDFRPSKDWDGTQYGFDWMRIAMETISNERKDYMPSYKGGIGVSYKKDYPAEEETDINQWNVKFVADYGKNDSLVRDYNMVKATRFADPEMAKSVASIRPYCCSWLCLFPSKIYPSEYENNPAKALAANDKDKVKDSGYMNTSANLRLFITLADDNAPDYLLFEKHSCLKFTPERIDTKAMKKEKPTAVEVTVDCERGFATDQVVRIHAFKDGKKKLAGKMFVTANDQREIKRATVKIQIVNVWSPNIGKIRVSGSSENQQDYIAQYLRQALITVEFAPTIKLNIANDPDFNAYFVKKEKINHEKSIGLARAWRGISNTYEYKDLIDYLYDRLIEQEGESFASDKILFFNMGTSCGGDDTAGYRRGNNIVMYKDDGTKKNKTISKSSYAHEVLHVLKLSHTFANKTASETRGLRADWTYRPLQTDNIMDYTRITYALWHWQWMIVRANTKIRR